MKSDGIYNLDQSAVNANWLTIKRTLNAKEWPFSFDYGSVEYRRWLANVGIEDEDFRKTSAYAAYLANGPSSRRSQALW